MANPFKDFTWFDKAATADTPAHRGFLSKLGGAAQGVAAPLAAAYGNDSGYKALQLQQQQDQADAEFQKYLYQKQLSSQELGNKKDASALNVIKQAYTMGITPDQVNALVKSQNGGGVLSPASSQPMTPPPEAMQSLASGQYGDIAGNPLGPIGAPQQPPSDISSALQTMQQNSPALKKDDYHQDTLENQYQNRLKTMYSNRSGVLGVAAQKADQAINLRTLINTSYDPDTKNYNLTSQQYHELAIGLAGMLAPNAVASDAKMQSLIAKSAEGDSNGLLQYLTGSPKNGSSQALLKNIISTIDREGLQSEKNRDKHLEALKDLIPSGLKQDRIDRAKKVTFGTSYKDFLKESPDYSAKKSSSGKKFTKDNLFEGL